MNEDIILDNVKAVLDLDFVDFVLKPSTGKANTKLSVVNDHATLGLLDICRLASDEQSYNLIDWADIVIVTHSSIFLEVLQQGKTFLYPSHFISLTGVFEDYEACWQVNSKDELISALRKAWAETGYRPYSKKNVDKLLEFMVQGGDSQRDVLAAHHDLVLKAERGEFGSNELDRL